MLQVQAIRICSWENCDQIRKAGTPTELTEIAFLNFERGKKKIGKREKCKTLTKHRECSIRKERIQFIFVSFAFALSFLLPLSVCAFDCFRLWFVGHPFETVFFPWSRRRVKHTNKFLIKVETKMKWKSIFSWHTAKLSANIFDLLFFLSVEGGFLFDVTITSSSNSSKKEQNKRIELSTKQWQSAPNNHAYNQNGRQR